MRELISQIMGMIIGSSIISFFGLKSGKPKILININNSKAKSITDNIKVIIVAVFFILIIGLGLYEIISLK